jgi:hypothetical protein
VALEISGTEFHVTAARPAPAYLAALEPGEADLREGVTLRTGDGAVVVEQARLGDERLVDGFELGRRIRNSI